MQTLVFDTDLLPAAQRLAALRAGATAFKVDAVGDPLALSTRFRLLNLGDLSAIRSTITPVHYRRDRAMIEADGEDRIAIHYYLSGGGVGELDGRRVATGPGGAMVWDLARTVDMRSDVPIEVLIVTMPRYMIDEVLPVPTLAGVLAPSPALALAAEQLRAMIDDAANLADAAAPFFGRAVRDLFAAAILPALPPSHETVDAPLLRRLCAAVDAAPDRAANAAALAVAIGASPVEIEQTAAPFGGLAVLVERRRLLVAYRSLRDPAVTAPVSAIAMRCGFEDMPHFGRRFREVFLASPSDVRRYHRGSLPSWAGAYHVERNYGAFIATH